MTTEYTPYLTPQGQRAEAEALGWLRENDPRNPAEQAALAAINTRRWILWHSNDRDLGVILLLSRLGLLRDRAYEEHESRTAQSMARIAARDRHVDKTTLRRLEELAEVAATQLEAGDDPHEIAKWIRDTRTAILTAQENAKRPTPTPVDRPATREAA